MALCQYYVISASPLWLHIVSLLHPFCQELCGTSASALHHLFGGRLHHFCISVAVALGCHCITVVALCHHCMTSTTAHHHCITCVVALCSITSAVVWHQRWGRIVSSRSAPFAMVVHHFCQELCHHLWMLTPLGWPCTNSTSPPQWCSIIGAPNVSLSPVL